MDGFFWIFIAIMVVGTGLFLAFSAYFEEQRRQALAQVAQSLGFRFDPEASQGIPDGFLLDDFELFQRGRHCRARNSLSKTLSDGTQFALFDYQYTTGSGKSRRTHHLSVLAVTGVRVALPCFRLHPENFIFHGIAKAFGLQDINFDHHPQFSGQYLLRGQDEPQIRSRFHGGVLDLLSTHPGYLIEARSGFRLLIAKPGRRARPEEVVAVFSFGEMLVRQLNQG